tara:strand:+ start:122 stop:631 length:510 start_codon:yes stop_codon:yes gene_type:complete
MALTDPINAVAVVPSNTLLIDGRTLASTPQGAWKSYNIIIGDVPATPTATTVISNAVSNGVTALTWSQPNAYIKAGMHVSGVGIATGSTVVSATTTTAVLSIITSSAITQGTILSFGYPTISDVKVTTINNVTLVITNPPVNQLLPLQVAQVWADSQNVSQISAYENQS